MPGYLVPKIRERIAFSTSSLSSESTTTLGSLAVTKYQSLEIALNSGRDCSVRVIDASNSDNKCIFSTVFPKFSNRRVRLDVTSVSAVFVSVKNLTTNTADIYFQVWGIVQSIPAIPRAPSASLKNDMVVIYSHTGAYDSPGFFGEHNVANGTVAQGSTWNVSLIQGGSFFVSSRARTPSYVRCMVCRFTLQFNNGGGAVRMGMFDEMTGFFIEISETAFRVGYNDGELTMIVGNNVMNMDTLDGNGPSGTILNMFEPNTYFIYYFPETQVLEYGMMVDNEEIVAHRCRVEVGGNLFSEKRAFAISASNSSVEGCSFQYMSSSVSIDRSSLAGFQPYKMWTLSTSDFSVVIPAENRWPVLALTMNENTAQWAYAVVRGIEISVFNEMAVKWTLYRKATLNAIWTFLPGADVMFRYEGNAQWSPDSEAVAVASGHIVKSGTYRVDLPRVSPQEEILTRSIVKGNNDTFVLAVEVASGPIEQALVACTLHGVVY